MAEISVMLPLYNARSVVWLALESLCRQAGEYPGFEVVVCEERAGHAVVGSEGLALYRGRLRRAGCERVRYLKQ